MNESSTTRLPWWPIGVVAITLALFAPAIGYDLLGWDDAALIVNNEQIRSLSWEHLRWMFTTAYLGPYQPIPWITWALDYQIWGLSPAGYHLGNIVLHALNAVLVFALSRTLFQRMGAAKGFGLNVACAVAALLFAVHPTRIESVVWASERREVLAGAFTLLSVLAYLRAVPRGEGTDWRWIGASSLLFFGALLCKASAVPLPIALLVIDVYPLRRVTWPSESWRETATILLEKVPYLLLAALAAWITVAAQASADSMPSFTAYSASHRILQAFYGCAFYVRHLILPIRLAPLYPLDYAISLEKPVYALSVAVVVGAVALLVWLRRRAPGLVTATACYLCLIAPVLGFIQVGMSIAADRYAYLPTVPFAILLGWCVRAALRRWPARRSVVLAACALVLAGFSFASVRYMRHWRSSVLLWTHTIRHYPSAPAFVNLGDAFAAHNEPTLALEAMDAAVEISPNEYVLRSRALLYLRLGEPEKATADLERAVELTAPGSAMRGQLQNLLQTLRDSSADPENSP